MPSHNRSNPSKVRLLPRSDSWRVIRLLIALGLVLVLMRQIRGPKAVKTLDMFFGQTTASSGGADPDPSLLVGDSLDLSSPGGIALATERTETTPSLPLQLEAEWLIDIADNHPFRPEEAKPWYDTLGVLARSTVDDVSLPRAPQVEAIQLYNQPGAYRGRLVNVRGVARQCTKVNPLRAGVGADDVMNLVCFGPPAMASLGVREMLSHTFLANYHRVDLQPPGAKVPLVLFALSVPEEFPVGADVREPIGATGYFFKNWVAPFDGQIGLAPVVLTGNLRWKRLRPAEARKPSYDAFDVAVTVGGSLVVALVAIGWMSRRAKPPRTLHRSAAATQSRPPDFSNVVAHESDARPTK